MRPTPVALTRKSSSLGLGSGKRISQAGDPVDVEQKLYAPWFLALPCGLG
jgi:hypothetical protein